MWLQPSLWSCHQLLYNFETWSAAAPLVPQLFVTEVHTRGFFLPYLRQRSHTPIIVTIDSRSGRVLSTYASNYTPCYKVLSCGVSAQRTRQRRL